jgi:hypothetical protein
MGIDDFREKNLVWEKNYCRGLNHCDALRVWVAFLKQPALIQKNKNHKKTRLKILPVLTREHYTSLLHWV